MGKFTPGSDQMQILFLQIYYFVPCERKVKFTHAYFIFQGNILLVFTFLFITDYMTVVETVDIVAN